jgi:hypothetical protein
MKNAKIGCLFLILVISFSCASKVEVVPLSKEARDRNVNKGIPYYLPKPYLLITRNVEFIATEEEVIDNNTAPPPTTERTNSSRSTTTITTKSPPVNDFFSSRIIYLPDISEKYGIKISRGTGTFKGKISIVDGWKFVGINLETDSKTKETLEGLGELIKALASVSPYTLRIDEKDTEEKKKIIQKFIDKLEKSSTIPGADLFLYDLSDLSKPVLHWHTSNK